ncbi:MAG: outer membrane beta-barrel protein [Verrucomicrobiae bacterium]|nr:outer membrane beta-barrel protein [Verrucomicrobiae bacterium]
MNKFITSLCAVAVVSTSLFAGDSDKKVEEMKKMLEDQGIKPNFVETKLPSVKLSGYVDTSYVYSPSEGNGASQSGQKTNLHQFDRDSNDFSVNAVKLALEKPLSDKNEFTAGFRTDLMYGEDAAILNGAAGINAGSAAFHLEQAYVQFRAPVGNGLDFKVGKFVTLLGYEVIESPANLNFSRGLLFTYAIPLEHVGALASYKFNDTVDMQLGIVNNWNDDDQSFAVMPTSSRNSFTEAITGRINVTAPGGNANIAQSFIISPNGDNGSAFGAAGGSSNVWVYDIWGNWVPKAFNDKLLLGLNFDIGQFDGRNTFVAGATSPSDALFYGVAAYAKYQFTPKFSLAGRFEYFVDESGGRVGAAGNAGVAGGAVAKQGNFGSFDVISETVTASFDLWENMIARLEYRYDQVLNQGAAFNNGTNDDQHQVALNFVYSF